MKQVRIKAILKDKVTIDIINLSFDDNDMEILQLFKDNYVRFLTARLIDIGLPSIKRISWDDQTGSKFDVSDFNYKDVSELLHLARPFFLSKEPASFERTCSILGKSGKGTTLTGHLKYIRSLYEKGEYLPLFQINIDGLPLFEDSTLKIWLNGIEYHQDKRKRDTYKKLELALGNETTKSIFVSQLSGRIKALHMLAHIVNLVTK